MKKVMYLLLISTLIMSCSNSEVEMTEALNRNEIDPKKKAEIELGFQRTLLENYVSLDGFYELGCYFDSLFQCNPELENYYLNKTYSTRSFVPDPSDLVYTESEELARERMNPYEVFGKTMIVYLFDCIDMETLLEMDEELTEEEYLIVWNRFYESGDATDEDYATIGVLFAQSMKEDMDGFMEILEIDPNGFMWIFNNFNTRKLTAYCAVGTFLGFDGEASILFSTSKALLTVTTVVRALSVLSVRAVFGWESMIFAAVKFANCVGTKKAT